MKKKFNPDEILREVNKFDKKFGLKLRSPKIWSDPENYKESYIMNSEIEIAKLICDIISIDLHEYYGDDFMEAMGPGMFAINVNDEQFQEFSQLNWDNKERTYWTDGTIFKSRFLTGILSRFMGRLSVTGKRKIGNGYICSHSRDEQTILYTNEVMRDCYKFINCLYNDNYKNIILKMHMHLSYTSKNIKRKKLYYRLNSMVIDTRKNLRHTFFKKPFLDDDICINNLLQIAYILATDDYEGNNGVPKFKKIEGATRYHDLSLLIENMGKRIIMNENKYSVMFKAFVNARPKIYCEFKDVNDNACLRMGVIALEYTKFVMNDKNSDKFIREMLKGGK